MDRPALPKEDLFDTSTMTFGEHLDELRKSLFRAIIWLIAGTILAFGVSQRVVRMIQTPLEQAIVEFNADASLSELGFDPKDALVQESPMRRWMLRNGMSWELVYVLPPELLDASTVVKSTAVDSAKTVTSSTGTIAVSDKGSSQAAAGPEVQLPTQPGSTETGTADPADLAATKLLAEIPDPSVFVPQLQLRRVDAGLNSHQVEEPFMIYLKASIIIGAVIASPGIFYHLWSFVAAGLYPHERRHVYVYLPFSVTLFVGGVCLAFFAVLGYVLNFLLKFNSSLSVDMEPRLSYYMSFVMLLPLGFGIAFQLPLVMLFLQRIGIFETSAYEKSWRIAVLVIAFLSMILTPADPYSMVLLMCPLIVLYFLGIGLCRFMPRGRGLGSDAYDPS